MISLMSENEQICNKLERGTLITKYYLKKRPEKRYLSLRRETRQILVNPVSNTTSAANNLPRNAFEFALEIREIKEIRFGKNSKDFDKWEDSKKIDYQKCFILLYGNEFKLKTFSVVAHSERECDMWIKGVKYLLSDTLNSPYPIQIERWLRKEFYAMENNNKS
jgi:phosphatidylinositol phospholipase C, gamma-1